MFLLEDILRDRYGGVEWWEVGCGCGCGGDVGDVGIYVAVCLVMHGSINEIEKMRKEVTV